MGSFGSGFAQAIGQHIHDRAEEQHQIEMARKQALAQTYDKAIANTSDPDDPNLKIYQDARDSLYKTPGMKDVLQKARTAVAIGMRHPEWAGKSAQDAAKTKADTEASAARTAAQSPQGASTPGLPAPPMGSSASSAPEKINSASSNDGPKSPDDDSAAADAAVGAGPTSNLPSPGPESALSPDAGSLAPSTNLTGAGSDTLHASLVKPGAIPPPPLPSQPAPLPASNYPAAIPPPPGQQVPSAPSGTPQHQQLEPWVAATRAANPSPSALQERAINLYQAQHEIERRETVQQAQQIADEQRQAIQNKVEDLKKMSPDERRAYGTLYGVKVLPNRPLKVLNTPGGPPYAVLDTFSGQTYTDPNLMPPDARSMYDAAVSSYGAPVTNNSSSTDALGLTNRRTSTRTRGTIDGNAPSPSGVGRNFPPPPNSTTGSLSNVSRGSMQNRVPHPTDPISELADAVISGQADPSQIRGNGNSSKAVLAKIHEKDPNFDIAKAQSDYKYAGEGSTKNTLNYLNSLTGADNKSGNLGELVTQSNGLPRTQLPPLNDAITWARLNSGSPQMAAYHATLTEVADQVAKILQGGGTGGGTSDAKLKQANELFQKGFTTQQIESVAGDLRKLLANRKEGIVGDNTYLKRWYGIPGQSGTPGLPAPPGGAQSALPPEARSALKEGHNTRFNNGQTWTLKNGVPEQVNNAK